MDWRSALRIGVRFLLGTTKKNGSERMQIHYREYSSCYFFTNAMFVSLTFLSAHHYIDKDYGLFWASTFLRVYTVSHILSDPSECMPSEIVGYSTGIRRLIVLNYRLLLRYLSFRIIIYFLLTIL